MKCTTCGNFINTYREKNPSGRYYCNRSCAAKTNNKLTPKRQKTNSCKGCQLSITTERFYCSKACMVNSRPEPKGRDPNKNKQNVKAYHKRIKLKAIEYLGGCCTSCGYNKASAALHFHHKDPTTKDFTISSCYRGWETVKSELDKCTLLCANCHAEEEYGVDMVPPEGLEPSKSSP